MELVGGSVHASHSFPRIPPVLGAQPNINLFMTESSPAGLALGPGTWVRDSIRSIPVRIRFRRRRRRRQW